MAGQTLKIPVTVIKYVYRYQKQLYFSWLLLSLAGMFAYGWAFFLGAAVTSIYGLVQVIVSIVDSYQAGYEAAEKEELRKAFE